MARRNKVYEDDDGRTIADMSDLSRPSLLLPRKSGRRKEMGGQEDASPSQTQQDWAPEDRRLYIFGALRAGLLIALIYFLGFGLLIGLLLLIWNH